MGIAPDQNREPRSRRQHRIRRWQVQTEMAAPTQRVIAATLMIEARWSVNEVAR